MTDLSNISVCHLSLPNCLGSVLTQQLAVSSQCFQGLVARFFFRRVDNSLQTSPWLRITAGILKKERSTSLLPMLLQP